MDIVDINPDEGHDVNQSIDYVLIDSPGPGVMHIFSSESVHLRRVPLQIHIGWNSAWQRRL